jgi:predicted transcriptional regulator
MIGEYVVEPLPPGDNPGTPADTVKVEPPEPVTLEDRITDFAVVNCPYLLILIQILIIIKLGLYLGFRKIKRKNVLENSSRSVIYHYIRESPGADFTEISRGTGISENSLRYHIAVLKLMNKVSVLETSRNIRYYENSGKFPPLEQKVLKHLRNKPTRTLLKLVKENPDLSRIQLELALGLSGAGINWHMHRLSDDGILAIRKDGRNARYELSTEAVPYVEKHLSRFDNLP